MNLIESLKFENSVRTKIKGVINWKEAVLESCKPLLESKAITQDYLAAIIESTIKFGPYYIIADQVAMPHASPGDYVLRNSFSLTTLEKPIYFDNDERPISILITLAPADSDFHMSKGLPQIVAIFEDEKNVRKIIDAKKPEDIYEILSKIDLNKYIE
ncbi:MAG: PTS sugar transporter subunit IIA [Mycoplasmataceae bacterium]|nr:PTS sugar transporter subunit IIA [Mycoplasmataceae bacterium]